MFKKDFLWGAATAANQCEGGWNLDNRGMTVMDVTTAGSKNNPRMITYFDKNKNPAKAPATLFDLPEGAKFMLDKNEIYPNHEGVDFYHHYKEDIKLMAQMGFKTFRMSISWSRLFPNGDEKEPNEQGIIYYKNIFHELKKYNIEPIVTLWHYDTPLHLEEKYGGWKNRKMIEFADRYAKTCFEEFKGFVKYWLTFNEINSLIAQVSMFGHSGTKEEYQRVYQILHYQFVASAHAVKFAHEIDTDNKVGCMIGGLTFYPATCDPKDILQNRHVWEQTIYYCGDVQCKGKYPTFSNRIWKEHDITLDITAQDKKDLLEGTVDMYSFSYYMSSLETTHKLNDDLVQGNFTQGMRNEYLTYSDWGWALDPDGLQYYLEMMYDRYELPLLIVENGLGAKDTVENGKIHDTYRIDYYREHIKAMKRAVKNGVNLIAYTAWSAMDIVSYSTGEMEKRYGFIYVDKKDDGSGDFSRIPKDSFYWYKHVIETNGEEL